MEACSGAHHWAREFEKLGHTVRLMAPKFVAPYRMEGKRGKNDANDAAAICEAVTRPQMRFVPVKSIEQQADLLVHRARQGYVQERTSVINRIRGLLSELGIVMALQPTAVRREAHKVLEDLPGWCNIVIGDLLSELTRLDVRIAEYDKHVRHMAQQNAKARQLMHLAGIGSTTASAIVASVGNAHEFKSSSQFSAWLGLTPSQHSSGGKSRLGRITKAGDRYLRTLLILGARAVVNVAAGREDTLSRWAIRVQERRGYWRAVVAVAAKNARMCWAALRMGESFRVPA